MKTSPQYASVEYPHHARGGLTRLLCVLFSAMLLITGVVLVLVYAVFYPTSSSNNNSPASSGGTSTPTVSQLSFSFALDFNMLNQTAFVQQAPQTIATQLGLLVSQVIIVSLAPGSVIAQFQLIAPSSNVLAQQLITQTTMNNSPLLSKPFFSSITTPAVLVSTPLNCHTTLCGSSGPSSASSSSSSTGLFSPSSSSSTGLATLSSSSPSPSAFLSSSSSTGPSAYSSSSTSAFNSLFSSSSTGLSTTCTTIYNTA